MKPLLIEMWFSAFLLHFTFLILHFINRTPAGFCAAVAAFGVGMKGGFVVNGNLFAGRDVTQGVELDVAVENFHEAVGLARVIDVVSAVAAATPVQTPLGIYRADAKQAAMSPALCLCGRDSLARVVCYLSAALETKRSKASFAVDWRFFNG
jgi:hypothetical protein